MASQGKLVASDASNGDGLGHSVALDGNTVLAGAHDHNNYAGAAYVFSRSGSSWSQTAKLVPTDAASLDNFGTAVALSGDRGIIGAPKDDPLATDSGSAYVFLRTGTSWAQEAKLTPTDAVAGHLFGSATAIDGDTAIVSASGGQVGDLAAYVFVRTAGTWLQQAKLKGDPDQHYFGRSVSLSGDTAVVGAAGYLSNPAPTGAAYVYVRTGSTWTREAKLVGLDTSQKDAFGYSVSISQNTVLVGAIAFQAYKGAAYVFSRSGTAWTQKAKLLASDATANGAFGSSVSISGQAAIVGASSTINQGFQTGAAYIFTDSGGTWSQLSKVLPFDGPAEAGLGNSTSLSGDTAVAGAQAVNSAAGAAYVFVVTGDLCTTPAQCASGYCVDGVCCNSDCADQCDSCSKAGGGQLDGLCTPASAGSPGAPACAPFVCNGTNSTCPTSCSSDADCSTGHCSDGFCCDKSCNGPCEACVQAKTGKPNGTCAPIPVGSDPDAECADDGSPSCAQNGLCDGAGACQKYPLSSGCTPQPCTIGSQCKSGFCTDGICCDTACTGPCRACTAGKKGKGLDGICEPIVADSDPDNECTQDAGYPANCGADGHCDGTGACRTLAKPSTACGASSCDGNTIKGQICNGLGLCTNDPQGQSCAPYVCQGAACTSSCANDVDCDSSGFCTTLGTCSPKQATGVSCTRKEECKTDFCVDGVCCNSPCAGQCQACDVAGVEGTCAPVVGAPHGQRPPCPAGSASAPCTEAICDGTTTTTCAGYVGTDKVCQPATCDGSSLKPEARCAGTGVCKVPPQVDCGAYQCAGGACKSTCTSPADCAKGHDCQSATCVSQASCDDDHTLSTPSGETKDCTPYRCTDPGVCLNSCASAADCVAGYSCSSTGSCVARDTPESADDSGCGCRTSRPSPLGSGFPLLLGLSLVLVARFRRFSTAARSRRGAAAAHVGRSDAPRTC